VPPLLVSHYNPTVIAEFIDRASLQAVCQKQDGPCKKCRDCRQAQEGNHPDVILMTAPKTTVSVKQVRELLSKIINTPVASSRLVVIHEAEKMSLPAASALLKTLEESSASTKFILATRWPARLPKTILSRSYRLRLAGVNKPYDVENLVLDITKQPLTQETVDSLTYALTQKFREQGATGALRRAFTRLRDYYLIKGSRGNEKLASEVLTSSLPEDLRKVTQ
jgi:DNA polymerase III gamma/tau subunit